MSTYAERCFERAKEAGHYRIPLWSRGGAIRAWAVVDAVDLSRVIAHRWFFDGEYPAKSDGRDENRVPRNTRMHRFILGLDRGDPREVDHINRSKLDNRRGNLRIVAHVVNGANLPARTGGTSRFRGVSWDAARGKWRASVRPDGRQIALGRFDSEEEAAAVVAAFWEQRDPLIRVGAS